MPWVWLEDIGNEECNKEEEYDTAKSTVMHTDSENTAAGAAPVASTLCTMPF